MILGYYDLDFKAFFFYLGVSVHSTTPGASICSRQSAFSSTEFGLVRTSMAQFAFGSSRQLHFLHLGVQHCSMESTGGSQALGFGFCSQH